MVGDRGGPRGGILATWRRGRAVSWLRTAGQGGARTRYSYRVERPENILGEGKRSAGETARGDAGAGRRRGLLGGEERPG